MAWCGFGVVVLLATISCFLVVPRTAANDFLAPLLAPVINAICNKVECGKGTCQPADSGLGFMCQCKPGWTQFHTDESLRFLPCVIPNCSINYSCYKDPEPPIPPPAPAPSNLSFFDPCKWSYCGKGTCLKTSNLDHQCDCNPGYSNLLNVSSFPCYQDCALGADCANLGITLSNSTRSPSASGSPDLPATGSSSGTVCSSPKFSLWFLILTTCFVMASAK